MLLDPSRVANLSAIAFHRHAEALIRDWNLKRHNSEGEEFLFILFIKFTITPSQLSKLQLNAPMADKQGKTLRHRLSQFILVWVRCHVGIDKYFVSIDEDGPPVLGFT